MKLHLLLIVLCLFVVSQCTSHQTSYERAVEKKLSCLLEKQKNSNLLDKKIKELPSIHFNLRKPQYIIIHQTTQKNCKSTLKIFSHPYSRVSAHYLICKDGTIIQVVEHYLRAWHAGKSKWRNIVGMNSVSLGVELANSGHEPFPKTQIKSLIELLRILEEKYKIPPTNILAHGDIAPSRKKDPNCLFPWNELAKHKLAVMPDSNLSQEAPPHFNYLKALHIIGYDIHPQDDAIRAFRRHFIGCNASTAKLLTAEELAVLKNVVSKYLNIE